MKHDLEAFSRDIVTLIKNSGDTGDTGDRSDKSLRNNNFPVPTRRALVSPLDSDWGQAVAASGDRKSETFESVGRRVPTVPTATTHFEEGRAAQIFEDSPAGWHAISEELKQMPAPEWAGVDRWFQAIEDADAFLSSWASAARDLGWTALNLFGVHAFALGSRYDVMGLVPLLGGGRVFALTEQTATIRRPSESTVTYTRKPTSGAVLLCGGHHALG